jgi:hypothetical protein
MATRRLKELLEARKPAARDLLGKYFSWNYSVIIYFHLLILFFFFLSFFLSFF